MVENCTFNSSYADVGGAINILNANNISIYQSNFDYNKATE